MFGSITPAAPLAETIGAKLRRAASAAAIANVLVNPVQAGAATITAPATTPSTTGMTNLLPVTGGWAASLTGGATMAGSATLTVTSTIGLAPGQPLVENVAGSAYPANVPLGATIAAVVNATTLTMSLPATGTASGLTVRMIPSVFDLLGGVPGCFSGNFIAAGGTTGNSVTPPTARGVGFAPAVIEFMTDAATFGTASPQIVLTTYKNGANPNAFRVAIDDAYVSATPTVFGADVGYAVIQLATGGVHKVRIEIGATTVISALWLTTGAQMWRPTRSTPIRAALFGDSYFLGGAAGSFAARNTAMAFASLMGWQPDLLAVGGTGLVSAGSNYPWANPYRIADTARRPYDVVTLLGSINDGGASIQALCQTLWSGIRANLPKAPILVFGVPTTGGLSAGAATALETQQGAAFTLWGDPNAVYMPLTGDPDGAILGAANAPTYIAADGSHPVDPSGVAYLAQRMARRAQGFIATMS